MTSLSVITLFKIIAVILQDITIVRSIVVERNLHTYYRIQIDKQNKTSEMDDHKTPREYFILQCPHRATTEIPLPKDMPICVMVGNYIENTSNVRAKLTPIHAFMTTFGYSPVSGENYNRKEESAKWPYFEDLRWDEMGKKFKPTTKPIERSRRYKPKMPKNIPAKADSKHFNVVRKQDKSRSIINLSPLRFLNGFEIFKNFKPNDRTEAFNVAMEKYNKGYASHGFHNQYHRDELQNDHIFYDDLDKQGKFRYYSHEET